MSLAQLVTLTLQLLERQQDALVRGDVAEVAHHTESLAPALAVLRGMLVRERGEEPPALQQLRNQLRVNRLLLENGLANTDHFVASLARSPEVTSVFLSEQV